MRKLQKFLKKWAPRKDQTHTWSTEAISQQIIDLASALNKDLEVINMSMMTKHPKNSILIVFTEEENPRYIKSLAEKLARELAIEGAVVVENT